MALAIWALSIRTVDFSVAVPLKVSYLTDESIVLLGHPPESVMVTFGSDGLSMLGFQIEGKNRKLEVLVDLRSAIPDSTPETRRLTLDPSLVTGVPPEVHTSGFSPAFVDLSLDLAATRSLPVSVEGSGIPARYTNLLFPGDSRVAVRGPASLLNSMDSLPAGPVSFTSQRDQQAPLQLPEGVTAEVAFITVSLKTPVPIVTGVTRAY
jgi:hypothetical protein